MLNFFFSSESLDLRLRVARFMAPKTFAGYHVVERAPVGEDKTGRHRRRPDLTPEGSFARARRGEKRQKK